MKLKLTLVLLSLLFWQCNSTETTNKYHVFLHFNALSNSISLVNDNIIYSSWDTSINVYNLNTKKKVFKKKTKSLCYAKTIMKEGNLFFPYSTEKFVCLQLSNDSILWELDMEGRCSNFDFINDSIIVASVKHYGLVAFNSLSGEKIYEIRYNYEESGLPDVSPWHVSYDKYNFYVSDWQRSFLSCFSKSDGILNWQIKGIGTAGKSIVINDKIFLGTDNFYKGGKILLISTTDGKILNEIACDYETNEIPILYDNFVYFYTYDRYLKNMIYKLIKLSILKNLIIQMV